MFHSKSVIQHLRKICPYVSWLSLVKLHIHGVVNMGSTPVEASSGVSMIDLYLRQGITGFIRLLDRMGLFEVFMAWIYGMGI